MMGRLEVWLGRIFRIGALVLLLALAGCGQSPEPPPPTPEGPLGLQTIGVKTTLPAGVNLDLATLEVQTGSGSSKLSSTGEAQSQSLEGSVSLAFLRGANGKMLLAGWVSANQTQINARSTAEVLLYFQLGAYFSTSDVRQQIISALSGSTALTPLEQAIATNLQNHPDGLNLTDPAISSALQQVRGVLSAASSKFANLIKPRGLTVKPDAPKSGILVKKADANQIILENAYRRRAVAFIDKLSYVPSAGGSSIDAFEANPTLDRDLPVPNGVQGVFSGTADVLLYASSFFFANINASFPYQAVATDKIALKLKPDDAKSTTYRVKVVGAGATTGDLSILTLAQLETRSKIIKQTFVLDLILPLITNVVLSAVTLQDPKTGKDLIDNAFANALKSSQSTPLGDALTVVTNELLAPKVSQLLENGNWSSAFFEATAILGNSTTAKTAIFNLVKVLLQKIIKDAAFATATKAVFVEASLSEALFILAIADIKLTSDDIVKHQIADILNSSSVESFEVTVDAAKVRLTPSNHRLGKRKMQLFSAEVEDTAQFPGMRYEWTLVGGHGQIISSDGTTGSTAVTGTKGVYYVSRDTLGEDTLKVKVLGIDGAPPSQIGEASASITVEDAKLEVNPGSVSGSGTAGETVTVGIGLEARGSNSIEYNVSGGSPYSVVQNGNGTLPPNKGIQTRFQAVCPDVAAGGSVTLKGTAIVAGTTKVGTDTVTLQPITVNMALTCYGKDPDNNPARKNGGAWGDPHMVTFDGLHYEFQAVGDYTLAKSTQDDFEVQVRYRKPVGGVGSVSYGAGLAARVGSSVVEVYTTSGTPKVYLDQILLDTSKPVLRDLPNNGVLSVSGYRVVISWGDSSVATINAGAEYFGGIDLNVPGVRTRKLEGLLGDGNNNSLDDLKIRGGAVLVNPRPADIYTQFRQSWRVPFGSASSLFSQAPDLWDPFYPPNVVTLQDLDPAAVLAAQVICAARGIVDSEVLKACVYDVALTGDSSFADRAFDADPNVLRVRVNPSVGFVPTNRTDRSVKLGAFVTGTDNRAVTWSSTGGSLQTNGNLSTFTAPTTEGTYTITATLTENPAIKGTASVFVAPPSYVYWDGGGDKHSFGDPLNWLEDKLPSADSEAIIIAPNGTELSINLNGQTVNTISTTGAVTFASGSLTATRGGQLNARFKLEGGNLNSSGTVVLNGQTSWAIGSLGGTGKFVNNGELSLLGANAKYLGVNLENTGTIKISEGPLVPNALGTVLKNSGRLEFLTDTSISQYQGYLNLQNTGTITKTGGTGIANISSDLLNTGTLESRSGTLRLDRGTLDTGTYTATTGATLQLGDVTLKGTLSGSPTGAVAVIDGNLQVLDTAHLNFAGTGFDFRGGGLGGAGKLVNDGLMLASRMYLSGTLENTGTMNVSGDIYSNAPGSIIAMRNLAGATIEFVNDFGIRTYRGSIALENQGLVVKTGGMGYTYLEFDTLTNTGTLESRSGTLQILGGTVVGGTYNALVGTTLDFAGTVTLRGTLSGNPAGAVGVMNGNLQVANTETAHLHFGGTGFDFRNGGIGGGGKLVNDALMLSGIAYLSTTLENAGSIKILGSLISNAAGTIVRNLTGATLEFVSDAGIAGYQGRINLENNGLILKSGGTGFSNLELQTLTNTGTLESRSGTLRIQDGTVIGGTYNALPGATLDFSGTVILKGTLSGNPAGTVKLNAGSNLQVLTGEEAHLNFSGTGFNFNTGGIAGAGKLVNDGSALLTGSLYLYGTLENTKTIKIYETIQSGAVGSSLRNLAGATLEFVNDSGIAQYQGRITFTNAGTLLKSGGVGNSTITTNFTNTGTITEASGHFVFTP